METDPLNSEFCHKNVFTFPKVESSVESLGKQSPAPVTLREPVLVQLVSKAESALLPPLWVLPSSCSSQQTDGTSGECICSAETLLCASQAFPVLPSVQWKDG